MTIRAPETLRQTATRELSTLAHLVLAANGESCADVDSDAVRAFAQTVLAFLDATS